jgi:hypothetical protein
MKIEFDQNKEILWVELLIIIIIFLIDFHRTSQGENIENIVMKKNRNSPHLPRRKLSFFVKR